MGQSSHEPSQQLHHEHHLESGDESHAQLPHAGHDHNGSNVTTEHLGCEVVLPELLQVLKVKTREERQKLGGTVRDIWLRHCRGILGYEL